MRVPDPPSLTPTKRDTVRYLLHPICGAMWILMGWCAQGDRTLRRDQITRPWGGTGDSGPVRTQIIPLLRHTMSPTACAAPAEASRTGQLSNRTLEYVQPDCIVEWFGRIVHLIVAAAIAIAAGIRYGEPSALPGTPGTSNRRRRLAALVDGLIWQHILRPTVFSRSGCGDSAVTRACRGDRPVLSARVPRLRQT